MNVLLHVWETDGESWWQVVASSWSGDGEYAAAAKCCHVWAVMVSLVDEEPTWFLINSYLQLTFGFWGLLGFSDFLFELAVWKHVGFI